MTTNAINKKALVVASDSRWSAKLDEDHYVVLDDSGFHKLAARTLGCMVVAGNLGLIEGWMRWFQAPNWDFLNTPALNCWENGELQGIVFHLILPNGNILDPGVVGATEYEDEARFVGTGAQFAHDCYVENRCVRKAVKTASGSDVCTGGEVLYVDLMSGASNLTPVTSDAQQVRIDMVNRGIVMNRKTIEPVCDFQEYAAKKAGAPGAADAQVGGLTISAPTGAPAFVWSQEQKSDLLQAFAKMAAFAKDGHAES